MKHLRIACDLDGVIFDVRGLLPLIKGSPTGKTYEEYYANIHNAPPIPAGVEVLKSLALQGHHIDFITGRNEQCVKATTDALFSAFGNNIPFSLHMRNKSDRRPACEVKKDIFTTLLADTQTQGKDWMVFEDKADCVEMYESFGSYVLHVKNDASDRRV